MKLAGHPLHVMFIHFPAALFPADLVFSFLGNYLGKPDLFVAAWYCLLAGVITGIAAMITGIIDLIAIPKDRKEAMGAGLVHGFINGVIVMVYLVMVYKTYGNPTNSEPSTGSLVTKLCLVLGLFFGNYLGGKLIYQHHIGINKTQ